MVGSLSVPATTRSLDGILEVTRLSEVPESEELTSSSRIPLSRGWIFGDSADVEAVVSAEASSGAQLKS